jgi:hypothetical protein
MYHQKLLTVVQKTDSKRQSKIFIFLKTKKLKRYTSYNLTKIITKRWDREINKVVQTDTVKFQKF